MGFFDKFKSSRDIAKEEIKEVPWKLLSDVSQLDKILEESKSKPVGIFKHSTRCGISKMVLRGFEREYDLDDEKASIYMLDLLNYRSISNEIAAKFDFENSDKNIDFISDAGQGSSFSGRKLDDRKDVLNRWGQSEDHNIIVDRLLRLDRDFFYKLKEISPETKIPTEIL